MSIKTRKNNPNGKITTYQISIFPNGKRVLWFSFTDNFAYAMMGMPEYVSRVQAWHTLNMKNLERAD